MGTINFVLIGARNTGKTCYLALLASHCPSITTANDDTTAYLKVQRQLLDTGELPQATASTMRELMFRYNGEHHKVDFSIDDYDGSFIESLSRRETEDDISRNALKAKIQESEGLLFFMPYETTHDEEALSNFEDEINTIISLIEEITQGRYKELPIPAVICVTKWDRSSDYQHENEINAAATYLEQNPYYQRACAKINKLFAHVLIQPVSAFGTTTDGIHPTKRKMSPYRLEGPLIYCLDNTFKIYDQKIEEFHKNNDEAGLFDYLSELYDDLKHHSNGRYCQEFNELERHHANRILLEVNDNNQLELTESQRALFVSIKNNALRKKILKVLQTKQSSNKSKKIWKNISAALTIIMIGIAFIYYTQDKKEYEAFTLLKSSIINQEISAMEIIKQAISFNEKWENPMKLPIRSWFESDRKKISQVTDDMIRNRLHGMMVVAKTGDAPNPAQIQKMMVFTNAVELWSNRNLLETTKNEIQPILKSYQLLNHLRDQLNKASSLALSDYNKLKKAVANVEFHWKEMDVNLDQMHYTIVARIKTDAKSASKSGNKDDLERSEEELLSLILEGDAEAKALLVKQINPALEQVKRQEKLNEIINGIKSERKPSSIEQVVQDHWVPNFTQDERKHIKMELQKQFESFEEQNIPSLRNLNSLDEIKGINVKIKKINSETSDVLSIGGDDNRFKFRYIRPNTIQMKFEAWKKKITRYERAQSKGVFGYITFIGNNSGSGSLGFNCSMTNHNIQIMIDGHINLPDRDSTRSNCVNSRIRWKIPVKLSQRRHRIAVTKHNHILPDTKWFGTFLIDERKIFTYINKGRILFAMGSYRLEFSK